MSTDPDQIRAQVAELLAEVSASDDLAFESDDNADIEAVAARLEAAHDVLVQALESVEKG